MKGIKVTKTLIILILLFNGELVKEKFFDDYIIKHADRKSRGLVGSIFGTVTGVVGGINTAVSAS